MAVEGGTYNRAMFTAGSSRGESYNMQLLPQVLPVEFTTLWTGGKTNDFKTQAIITVKGRTWSDGRNYMKLIFTQKA